MTYDDSTAYRDTSQFPFGPYAEIGYCLDAPRWLPRGSASWTIGRGMDSYTCIDREHAEDNRRAADLEERLYREAIGK